MPSDTHRHDHDHAEDAQTSGGSCCGVAGTCGDIVPATPAPAGGRSFQVSGLDCAEEVAILNKVVGPKIGGAEHLAFDVINGRMTILDSAKSVSDGEIAELVASTGMTAKPWDAENASVDQAAHLARQRLFTALSGGFWAAGFLWHIIETGMGGALGLFAGHGEAPMPLVEAGLFAVAILFGVWLVAPKAWSSARRLSPDMNLLMVVAVAGAIGLGEFFEAATVAFFFSLSLFLESWSVGRARNAVSALLDLAPPTARILYDDGSEADVPASAVAINVRFVVRGGDRIPLDGEVVDGAGAVDQAPITGESALVPKERGDEVYAGTINGEGTLTVRATKAASDTVLARIIRMVGDAHARRAPVEQWVAKFARIYTPIVMALAIAIALLPPLIFGGAWDYWFYNALVLLVIACPCALVISTPVSIVAALAASARAGVLIKGGAYVEAPGKTTALAMDKTGTITMGEPEVAAVHPLGKASAQDLMTLAAGLEARSSHPLARAILARAEADGINVSAAQDTRTVPGRGLEGRTDGRSIWLGSDRFAEEKGFGDAIPKDLRDRIEGAGSTLVAVGDDTGVTGILELRDRIRPDAKGIVAQLHAQGVKTIVMLTGDNERTARAVAAEVGIDEVRAELLPEDKVTAIEELVETHDMVAMIGDGVNDAPAMARAHYAIAMGAVGSDAAIETADIALMTDDLGKVPWLIGHSRRTMSIIHQNIGISLATKGVFVVATAFGVASMWGAIAADVGVSLLVVANALRLLNSQKAKAPPSGGEQVGPQMAKAALAHGH
ncbi:cation-translocating P-type ATPase [Dinoroseobacter sp. PD6]|uniref:heavy metal translocating P-type ATPase n=1 Tax=Dinoroseobacter sp. PD6 TaxID=3028384 RepID=UPI00237AEFA6|nr:cation-translocating P-type ATPase [Dinoroseobacter sp. PD6]MDD9718605.1 cation-translocating P-type ATPase [Dinoroseobacter sp. PD6]